MSAPSTSPADFDLTHATDPLRPEVQIAVAEIFQVDSWKTNELDRSNYLRVAFRELALKVIEVIPPCPDRSAGLRKLHEAQMEFDSALTHNVSY